MLPRWLTRLLAAAVAVGVIAYIPAWLCGRWAGRVLAGDAATQVALAAPARAWLARDPETLSFATGSPRFDGEWYLIVHMAAALGFAQTALQHPSLAGAHQPLVERAIDRLLLPRGRRHDRDAWGEDPVDSLDGAHGHLAFLAYANLALSMQRRIDPGSRFAALNDRISDALARRFAVHPGTLLESYPGETYPADNAVAVASIMVHDRATGRDPRAITDRVLSALRQRYADPASGLLYQRVDSRVDPGGGGPRDAARASGTAMAAFALGYAGREAARPFWQALARQSDDLLGFGGVREYARPRAGAGTAGESAWSTRDGAGADASASAGDIDSGPLIFGFSVSATGFALASARRFGDGARLRSYLASAWLLGLPRQRPGALDFVAGGPLGGTLLFALLTAGGEP